MDAFRNQELNDSPLPTYILIQFLTWLSIFTLVKIYLKRGSFFVYYYHASSGGFRLVFLLRLLGMVTQEPVQIKDIRQADTPHCRWWNYRHLVFQQEYPCLKLLCDFPYL